jgi:hypothetical protein
MSKEMGPRERQLREQRERDYEENQKRMKAAARSSPAIGFVPSSDTLKALGAKTVAKRKAKKKKARK